MPVIQMGVLEKGTHYRGKLGKENKIGIVMSPETGYSGKWLLCPGFKDKREEIECPVRGESCYGG